MRYLQPMALTTARSNLATIVIIMYRTVMKLFDTSDIALVKQCQEQFNFTLPSVALEHRRTKFMHKLCCVDFTRSSRSIQGGPKTGYPGLFWDNFGNSAPILTILSLLQAEIYGA